MNYYYSLGGSVVPLPHLHTECYQLYILRVYLATVKHSSYV